MSKLQVKVGDETWSRGDDFESSDRLPLAGIHVKESNGNVHGNAVEFYAETLSVAQSRRDAVLRALKGSKTWK